MTEIVLDTEVYLYTIFLTNKQKDLSLNFRAAEFKDLKAELPDVKIFCIPSNHYIYMYCNKNHLNLVDFEE